VGFNLVPDTTLDQLVSLEPHARLIVLSCWCLPDRRWGGLFTVSAKRLAHYTGLSVSQVENSLLRVSESIVEWDAALDLLWVPGIAVADMARCSNAKQLKGLATNIKQAPACPLRERAVAYLIALPHALSNDLSIALSNDLSITPPIGPVGVGVGVGVGKPSQAPAPVEASDEECDAAMAAVHEWTRILKGTRHAVTQEQVDAYSDEFIRVVASVTQEEAKRMALAVRANKWLREEAGVVSFPWAIKNKERLLRGEWSPDSKR